MILLNASAAPPAFLVELPEKTTVEVGGEISFVCHVECSPLCGLEWLVDGKSVQGKQGVGGDRWDQPEQWDLGDQWDRGERWDRGEDFVVDLDELDADVEIGQFTSVTSTLTWLNPSLEKTEFSVECRQGWFGKLMFCAEVELAGRISTLSPALHWFSSNVSAGKLCIFTLIYTYRLTWPSTNLAQWANNEGRQY